MKNLKFGILLSGVLGIVGMLMSGIGAMLEFDKVNTILMLAAFGLPIVMAIMGITKPPFQMWQAAVSLAGFALAVVKLRLWETIKFIADVPTELKLLMVGAILGVILSLIAVAKPEAKA